MVDIKGFGTDAAIAIKDGNCAFDFETSIPTAIIESN
ncbi:hypothetical protein UYO_2697, partial [Lachnospiraceae bacterium JC7]